MHIQPLITIPIAGPIGPDNRLIWPGDTYGNILRKASELFTLSVENSIKIWAIITDDRNLPPTNPGTDVGYHHVPFAFRSIWIVVAGPGRM